MSLTKNLNSKKIQIVFLKFVIIRSIVESSLKQFIVQFASRNFIVLGALLLPIAFYYNFFENSKYKKILALIEQNLPGTVLASNKTTWDTFQKTHYFPISNHNSNPIEKQIFQSTIQNINYWGEFITFEFNKKWQSYQKQYFIGYKNNSNLTTSKTVLSKPLIFYARDNVNSSFYSCIIQDKQLNFNHKNVINFFQKKFYQLDEFPLKLENIYFTDSQKNLNLSKDLYSQNLFQPSNNLVLTIQLYESKILQMDCIGIKSFSSPTSNISNPKLTIDSNSKIVKNSFEFRETIRKLENQFKELFYKNGYLLPKKFVPLDIEFLVSVSNLLGTKFTPIASNQILKILDEIPLSQKDNYSNLKLHLINFESTTFLSSRKMSGFTNPDMRPTQLIELNRQNEYFSYLPQLKFFSNREIFQKVKIYLGSHFSYPNEYLNINPDPIKLKLKYYLAKFEGLDGTVNYAGPTILSKFDQDLSKFESYNWYKVRFNLQSILNKDDPHQISNLKFFSNSVSDILFDKDLFTLNKLNFQEAKKNHFYKNVIKRSDVSGERDTFTQSFNYNYEYVVPYLNSKEWYTWLNNLASNNSNSTKTPYIQSFPIRQIAFLNSNQLNELFDSMDYQNPSKVFGSLCNDNLSKYKLNFYEYPFIQSAISSDLTRKNYTNVAYLKRINHYKFINQDNNSLKNRINNFYNAIKLNSFAKKETWEPIHSTSWLVISQYVFAVFILYLLRQFALSYGRELVSYLIDLFSSLGIFDASFKDELISENSKYRIIDKPKTRFQNIAGIEQIFSQLSEIIWFLRNSKRFLDTGTKLPKGILLVGPPGTGKTLLVQAIAGEAQVPIFLQPAGAFNNSESLGAQRLQQLFEKAKQLSPCIIFFDEIDSIGQRRSHIIQNPAGNDSLFAIVTNSRVQTQQSNSRAIPFKLGQLSSKRKLNENKEESDYRQAGLQTPDQLSLLMQLLIELDGLQSTKKVIVIGATNRVDVLDPALIRPGRFDKVLQLGLPKKLKRIQICQLYAQILGTSSKIYWEFIGNKTFGLSGADLATIMNQSSIDAILNGTKHTMHTIEVAINKIIGDSTESHFTQQFDLTTLTSRSQNQKYQITDSLIPRLAYYHAGITISKLLLPQFKTPISCSLFPKKQNIRYKKVANDFFTAQLQISRRHELKSQILAFYSGKICELFYFKKGLNTPNSHFLHSDFSSEDLVKATNLIYQLVDKWHLYSHNYLAEKLFNFSTNFNSIEISDSKTDEFLTTLIETVEIQSTPIELMKYYNFQNWAGKSWWQIQVSKEESLLNGIYSNWYRIYLKNPDETLDNDEWVVPDRYYHNNETFFLTKTQHSNDLYLNKRDSLYQILLHTIIQEVFELFYQNVEFIDFFVTFLIQNKYVRRFEIDYLYTQFFRLY